MKNQLIENLPDNLKGSKFKIHNYYVPTGVLKAKGFDFDHFPTVIYKTTIGECYHLFELIAERGTPIMAFCIIKK